MKTPFRFVTALSALVFVAGALSAASKKKVESLEDLSRDTYVWGYPAVLMTHARKAMLAKPPLGLHSINHFVHSRQIPETFLAPFIQVHPENLYSWAWADLTKEPLVMIQAPTRDRYYSVQFVDAYSNVFKIVSNKDFREGGGDFVIVGPNWAGEVPEKATLIHSPTTELLIVAQTFVGHSKELSQVLNLHRQRHLVPLTNWNQGKRKDSYKVAAPTRPPKFDKNLATLGFPFLEELQALVAKSPPFIQSEDREGKYLQTLMAQGKTMDRKKLEQGLFEGEREIQARLAAGFGPKINGWSYELKAPPFTTDYPLRAAVSKAHLFSPPPEDTLQMSLDVDSESRQLSSNYRYVLHFEKDDFPPSHIMWSVRVHEMKGPLMAFLNEKSTKFKYNMDGSLDLLIQNEEPASAYRSNWLRLRKDVHFQVVLAMFNPNNSALNRKYIAPSLTRIDDGGIPKQRITHTMMAQLEEPVSK